MEKEVEADEVVEAKIWKQSSFKTKTMKRAWKLGPTFICW